MTNPEGPYVKVHFRLVIKNDWPPASVESLWAVDQGDGGRIRRLTPPTYSTLGRPWAVRGCSTGTNDDQ
ncbi:hypothetical protein [Streptomyces mirabilis]|uniref:hypothetical protein n=1 Tax=Streptomyces mirabilis TaxID=68239 RepID=UPI0033BE3165